MKTPKLSLILGFGLVAAAPASADVLTSRIVAHDPATHTITLSDKEILTYDPKTTELPSGIGVGEKVSIEFKGSEGDMSRIVSIKRLIE